MVLLCFDLNRVEPNRCIRATTNFPTCSTNDDWLSRLLSPRNGRRKDRSRIDFPATLLGLHSRHILCPPFVEHVGKSATARPVGSSRYVFISFVLCYFCFLSSRKFSQKLSKVVYWSKKRTFQTYFPVGNIACLFHNPCVLGRDNYLVLAIITAAIRER